MGTPEHQSNRSPSTMESRIFITHYINPHQFWYKPFHPGSRKKQQKQLQDAIDEYCEQHYLNQSIGHYEPVFGEVVAFYDPSLARWTRCSVDGVRVDGKGTQRYRLWSIDEGCPKTVGIEQLRPLPDHFHDRSTSGVKRGAIKNIFPAQCVFDPREEQLRIMECGGWAETANIMLRSFIDSNQQLCFTSVTPYTVGKESIHFGDLLFVTKSKTYNAANLLVENAMGLTVEPKNFIIHARNGCNVLHPSSIVSGSLSQGNSSGDTYTIPVDQQRNEGISLLNGVNEREFDESVSMVGTGAQNNQPVVAADPLPVQQPPPPSVPAASTAASDRTPVPREASKSSESSGSKKSIGLAQKLKLLKAQKLKAASPNTSKERESSSTGTGSQASGHHSNRDPFEQIRKDAYALTIDVGLSEKAEYELLKAAKATETSTAKVVEAPPMEHKPKVVENAAVVPTKAVEPKAKTPTKPMQVQVTPTKASPQPQKTTPSPAAINSTASTEMTPPSGAGGGSSLKQRLMQRIANAKAQQQSKQKQEPEQPQSPELSFAPAGITNDQLIQRYLEQPTVQSNAEMKKFEKVIQGEKCIFSRRSHYRVLVHGAKTPKPIDRIAAANFSPRVHQELDQLGIKSLQRLQAYSWPHILRENSFICVNGASTGKTFAYLPAVCSVVQRQIEESLVKAASGPVAIIATYTSREVQRIARYRNMVICIGAFLEAAVYAKARFVIQTFVGEERKQTELIRHLKQHDYRSERTIVFGNDSDDLVPIVNALRQNSINHIVGSERMVLQQHAGFSNWDELQPGDMVVLVCSDTVLGDLKISKAQHIIHYSLAATWSSFTRRYACSFGYYDCPYLPAKGKEGGKGLASSLVLLNEKNNQQLPRLVDFLELHQEQIPEELAVNAQKIRSILESSRVASGRAVSMLCTYILGFAVCRAARNCVFRHTLTLDDLAPDGVPRSGKVRMKICHVFSPAHFAARLEHHCPAGESEWTVLNDTKRYMLQDMALQVYFNNESRHQMHGDPHRNDLCVVFEDQKYWRCQIINYDETKTDNVEVQLLAIDTGRIMHMKAYALLHLPEQFRALPAQAINVRFAAIVPHDYEQDWDKIATNTVRRWIENYATRPNCNIQGNVLLALKDTVWVDELYLVEELDGMKTTVTVERIRASLIAKQYGVSDKESFERIRKLVRDCEKHGMQLLRREVEELERDGKAGAAAAMEDVLEMVEGVGDDELMRGGIGTGEISFDSNETLKLLVHVDVPIKDDQGMRVSDDEHEKQNDSSESDDRGKQISDQEQGKEAEKMNMTESSATSDEIDNGKRQQTTIAHATPPAVRDDDDEGEVLQKLPEIVTTPAAEESIAEDTDIVQSKLMPIEADSTMSSSSSFELVSPAQDATAQYQFDSLLVGKNYSVMIGHYLTPDNFYVSQSNRIREVDALIKDFTKEPLTPLNHPRVGQHCLALFENFYHRGRIVSVLPESREVDVFLVDFGGTVRCREIFKASDNLLSSVPFLAIKGSFAHIHPPGGATEWTGEVADAIYDRWLEQHNQGTMYAIVTKVLPWVEQDGEQRIEGCHRYEMVLCDANSQDMFSIVSDIAYDGLAMWVGNEDGVSSTVPDTDEDDHFTQVNFTHEELMELMQKASSAPRNGGATHGPARAIKEAVPDSRCNAAEQLPVEKKVAGRSLETSDDEKSAIRAARRQRRTLKELRLDCDYRFPSTVWDQDEYFVVLHVHAPDVKRYNLTLTHTSLLLQFVREDEGERFVLGLTLRNPIVPRDSVHGVRGLTIVLRLRKLVPGLRWPTLDTLGSKRLRWVQFGRGGGAGDSSSDEMVKENRWKDLLRAHLDSSSVDSVGSGNEQTLQDDSDAEDEDGVFLGLD
uniref:RNA helicase n=1 Tax=Anopheles coluzzii TaxID=1518534 RepID=A0A6E8W2R9_ANOCL